MDLRFAKWTEIVGEIDVLPTLRQREVKGGSFRQTLGLFIVAIGRMCFWGNEGRVWEGVGGGKRNERDTRDKIFPGWLMSGYRPRT